MMPLATALTRPGHRRYRGVLRGADPAGSGGRSLLLEVRPGAVPARRPHARHPGLRRLSRPGGRGNLAAGYPALRAQQSVYVVKQLNDYASGARYTGDNAAQADPNAVMMFTIAKRLTPEQIRDVASYAAGHALSVAGPHMMPPSFRLALLLALCACARQEPPPPAGHAAGGETGTVPRRRRRTRWRRRARRARSNRRRARRKPATASAEHPASDASLEKIAGSAAPRRCRRASGSRA